MRIKMKVYQKNQSREQITPSGLQHKNLKGQLDKMGFKLKYQQFWKEDNNADDCGRYSTDKHCAGTNILHIANSIILFRLYDIGQSLDGRVDGFGSQNEPDGEDNGYPLSY